MLGISRHAKASDSLSPHTDCAASKCHQSPFTPRASSRVEVTVPWVSSISEDMIGGLAAHL
jgi:hypothetical protein